MLYLLSSYLIQFILISFRFNPDLRSVFFTLVYLRSNPFTLIYLSSYPFTYSLVLHQIIYFIPYIILFFLAYSFKLYTLNLLPNLINLIINLIFQYLFTLERNFLEFSLTHIFNSNCHPIIYILFQP